MLPIWFSCERKQPSTGFPSGCLPDMFQGNPFLKSSYAFVSEFFWSSSFLSPVDSPILNDWTRLSKEQNGKHSEGFLVQRKCYHDSNWIGGILIYKCLETIFIVYKYYTFSIIFWNTLVFWSFMNKIAALSLKETYLFSKDWDLAHGCLTQLVFEGTINLLWMLNISTSCAKVRTSELCVVGRTQTFSGN